MLHVTAIIEDTVIVATGRNGSEVDIIDVVVTDNLSGKQKRAEWTFRQLSAVLALSLGMGEDETLTPEATERLYEIARPVCTGEDWEGVCPIP